MNSFRSLLVQAAVGLVLWTVGCGPSPSNSLPPSTPPASDGKAEVSAHQPTARSVADMVLPVEVVYTGQASADQQLPLVVALHGYGSSPDSMRRVWSDLPMSARVVLPRAPKPTQSGGWAWFPIRKHQPDIDKWDVEVQGAAEQVVRLLGELMVNYPTKGKPLVTGFSQGGMLSFAAAALAPEAIAASIPVSGALPTALLPKADGVGALLPKVVAFHGDADPLVDVGLARDSVGRLSELGYDATLKEYPGVPHAIPAQMRQDLYLTVEGLLGP